MDAYLRVSQVRGRGDDLISPKIQLDQYIKPWCTARGIEVLNVYEELDESGAKRNRPMLLEAIERIERGESKGIIVAKLDRFGRSLIDGLQLIERIHDAGGTFISVAEGFDLTTDMGKLVLRIMLSLAEFELDRIRTNWHDAKANAVARGIHPCAHAPFGYRREGRGGQLLVDEAQAEIVRALFEMRANGMGFSALARWLGEKGVVTITGKHWSPNTVRGLITNEVYLGVAFFTSANRGTVRNKDAHAAIIDRKLWEAAQRRKGENAYARSEQPSLILPLLRCAGCRYTMRGSLKRGIWHYSCRCKLASGGWSWDCNQPSSLVDHGNELEKLVLDWFHRQVPQVRAEAREASPEVDRLEREAADLQAAFEAWRDDPRYQANLDPDDYIAGLEARRARWQAKLDEVAREQGRLGLQYLPPELSNLADFDQFSFDERRALLRGVIQCVFVSGKQSDRVPLESRVCIVPVGRRIELPQRGKIDYVARPFVFEDREAA